MVGSTVWARRRNFSFARKLLVRIQNRFTPTPGLYTDLFDKYQPDMVIASTPGWRMDRYLLRESARRGIPNMTVIVGWDNSSSYNVSGADVQWATCWSELQKEELVRGSVQLVRSTSRNQRNLRPGGAAQPAPAGRVNVELVTAS